MQIIHEDLSEYSFTEYMGELYRMNLSCNSSDYEEKPPMNSCLFFKVFGDTKITDGTSYNPLYYAKIITNDISFAAKFNGEVPGTIHFPSEYTQTTTIVDKSNTETTTVTLQSSSPMPTTLTEETHMSRMSNNIGPVLEIGTPLFYGVVAAGSAIIFILLLCVIGVSILVCRRGCKCVKHYTKQLMDGFFYFHR